MNIASKKDGSSHELPSLVFLQVEVLVVLCGVGDLGKLAAFLALCLDEVLDKLFGEYAALCEVSVV